MNQMEKLKNDNMNLSEKIYIFDTTLRDGEQTPGVALTVDEKIQIAQKLNNLGVDKIEVGFPASSKGEIESARKIMAMDLDSTLVGLSRSLTIDIDAVLDADLDYIHTFIGTSPLHRDYKLNMSKEKSLILQFQQLNMPRIMGSLSSFLQKTLQEQKETFSSMFLMKSLVPERIF